MQDKIKKIRIDLIDLPEDVLRSQYDEEELDDLARSIDAIGLLQQILVKTKGERYELVAGFRRTLAHKLLGKETIQAVIKPEDYSLTEAATLVENIQRVDLPVLDEARACRNLVDSHGWGIPETAKQLGKSQAWVRGRLDLLRLPENMAEALQKGEIGIHVALELSRIPNDITRDTMLSYAVVGGCTSEQARRWREQAERDAEIGIGPTIQNGEESALPPQEIYEMTCQICVNQFDAVKVRIIKCCPHCHQAIMTMKEDDDVEKRPERQASQGDGV